ncbi:MAG: HTH domain-containing protein [Romboutsia sp.]
MKNRQFEILIYLLKYKKCTYSELALKFEVSTKTIERDIDRLSVMGIPVYCSQGFGGGVFLDENYKFSTSFFTQEDIQHIVLALRVADSFSTIPRKDSIIQKLCFIAPELTVLFERDMQNYLSIDIMSEQVDKDTNICKAINFCLDEEVFATINGVERVACIGYVLKVDGLYLFSYNDKYQLFKVNDIKEIQISDTYFERDFLSYEEYKKNIR